MLDRAIAPYTAAEIEAALRDPTRYERRFELLDQHGNKVTELRPSESPDDEEGVIAATADFDIDRAIKGGLKLTMLPPLDDELRRDLLSPFQFRVDAYFGWVMPDGKVAEQQVGRYLWQKPERTVGAPRAPWTVSMGDLTHIYDAAGPGLVSLSVNSGQRITDGIIEANQRAGFDDLSGIVSSSRRQGGSNLEFNFRISGGGHRVTPRIERYINGRPWYVWEAARLDGNAEVWNGVLSILHDAVGYMPPHVDHTGRPIARPAIDYAGGDPAMILDSGPDSILRLPFPTSQDLSAVGNRAIGTLQGTGTGATPAVVTRLESVLPDHPLTESRIGFFIDVPLRDVAASSSVDLANRLRSELVSRASFYEHVPLPVRAWPFFEPLEPVGVRVEGDDEFDALSLFQLRGWGLDMFSGRQTVDLRRLYRLLG